MSLPRLVSHHACLQLPWCDAPSHRSVHLSQLFGKWSNLVRVPGKKVIRLFLPLLPIGYRDYLHVSHVHKLVYSARHAESHTGRHVNLGTQFWDHSCPPEVGSFSNKTFRRGEVLKTRAPTDNGKCQI